MVSRLEQRDTYHAAATKRFATACLLLVAALPVPAQQDFRDTENVVVFRRQPELEEPGSDADTLFAEGRDQGSLFRPHEELWPEGMSVRIHREMRARFDAR